MKTRRHTALLLLLVLPVAHAARSQSHEEEYPLTSRHALYLELGGQGGLYSVNYDFRVLKALSLRAGFTKWVFPAIVVVADVTAVPVMINTLIGGRRANLELGIGFLAGTASGTDIFFGSTSSNSFLVATATIGYRHQSVDGGFVFRVAFTPILSEGAVYPGGGISFGHSF